MKLNKYIYYIALSGVLLTAAGCKKYLEKTPDLRTKLNSKDKVAQLLVSAYPKADYLSFTENSSDNSEDKGPSTEYIDYGSNTLWEAAYFWRDFENGASTPGSSDGYWNACYLAIASANSALEYIDEHPNDVSLIPYRGEALVARAYAHFMLVTLYSKTYNIGGDNTSPGIPYVTKPETVVAGQYKRETVRETYDKIERDLTEGITMINNSVYKVPKYHFTSNAANAFAARFYLFKGDYNKVITYAGKVFTSAAQAKTMLRPWNTSYLALSSGEFRTAFTQSNQNSNLLLAEAGSAWARNFYGRYSLGQTVMATIDGPNISGGRFAHRNFNREPFYSLLKFKELFFESQIGSGFGDPYVMVPLFTSDELLMNRAEAYSSSNQFDLALADINTFLSTRILNYNPAAHEVTLAKIATYYGTPDAKAGLIKTILDLKKVEFISEGLRWFDLNRHKLTIRHLVLDANRGKTYIELKADDPRRLFQLPNPVVKAGLELNPR
ncbi:RagB/SusD family nutrient uptake outer membrane protein [Pedobacter steynii]|uniref:SusD family protein n=1 Tax=Pedobacter steynii TaxID=430522 RepID=A0A1D7QGD1_9SPHI|nr:RagB/SusD family nutrient uptake outer membrane protein [Pedobacter steynii]AOM77746.1 hypothetical protein BFS30_11530 [Pedobacter steynii]